MEWRHLIPVTIGFHRSHGSPVETTRYSDSLVRLNRIVRGELPDWWKEGAAMPVAKPLTHGGT
jgi:hypothetical protein